MLRLLELLRHASRAPEILRAARLSSSWVSFTQAYLQVGRVEYPLELRFRSGARLRLVDHEEVAIAWNVCVRSSYRIRATDRVIIDAGGNVGIFAVHAAHIAPGARIFSLEPFPANFVRLQQHVALNRLGDRVTPIQRALAGENGVRGMQSAEIPVGPRKHLRHPGEARKDEVTVECRTLTSALDEIGLREIDYMKVDIEGAEHETLLGTPPEVLRRVRRFDIEVHELDLALGYTPERLIRHLEGAGYHVTRWETDAHHTSIGGFERGAEAPGEPLPTPAV